MDQIILYPPGATSAGGTYIPSQIGLGSWIGGDSLPDFGTHDLIQSIEATNALRDGGLFAFRHAPVRKMAIPLTMNPQYGVNRVFNSGFEAGLASWNVGVQGPATFSIVPNASGGNGSYIGIATVAVGTGFVYVTGMLNSLTPFSSLPSGVPMYAAMRVCDFTSPSGAAKVLETVVRISDGVAHFIAPDQPAPGIIYETAGGLPTGLPAGWQTIGGIFSASALSQLNPASPYHVEFLAAFQPSAVGASYVAIGVDEIEFRVADRQRAVREWETELRNYMTPGGYISVQPENVPTSEAVFFDVLDGRWEPDYSLYENRANIRRGILHLDTQPYGYWPTEILLASAASVGFMGNLTVNGASVIGDVPPLAHVSIMPTVASVFTGTTVPLYVSDMVGVSFGARPSFDPFIEPAQWIGATSAAIASSLSPSLIGDQFAPASQALLFQGALPNNLVTLLGWSASAISSALEPAYRGRFRVFAFVRLAPSCAPWQIQVDTERVQGTASTVQALASGNQVATVYSAIGSPAGLSRGPGLTATVFNASPAYSMLDMGEMTLPGPASGVQGGVRFRLWQLPVSQSVPNPPYQLRFGGLYLLPVDGQAGILTRGMYTPTLTGGGLPNLGNYAGIVGSQGGVEFNNHFSESVHIVTSPGNPVSDGLSYYRGLPLRIGASTNQLLFITGDRAAASLSATAPVVQGNFEYAQVSVSYRPQFQFLYGV